MRKLTLGALAVLAMTTFASAQSDAVVIRSSNGSSDVPRLVVTTSVSPGTADVRVESGTVLRFTSTGGYVYTVGNDPGKGLFLNPLGNWWEWHGGSGAVARLDLDDGTFDADGNISTDGAYQIGLQTVLETATDNNTYVGLATGRGTGDDNTFVGHSAGSSTTTGAQNVFVGPRAGFATAVGSLNTFLGYQAGEANTSSFGTFVGHQAGLGNTSGEHNTFVGTQAGTTVTTGDRNTLVGGFVTAAPNASDNTFLGYRAGRMAGGLRNTAVGSDAGGGQSSNNTSLGYQAGESVSGADNVMLGSEAGRFSSTGQGNVFVGRRAGQANGTGFSNTYVGYEAGLTSAAAANTFVGYQSGLSTTTGTSNTLLGYRAGNSLTAANSNTFLGTNAGSDSDASLNTFVGYEAGRGTGGTGTRNTSLGALSAGANGDDNTMLGYFAGGLTTGGENVFVDAEAGRENLGGTRNVFVGRSAGRTGTTATDDVYVGSGAGSSRTGNRNVVVGSSGGATGASTGNRNVFVGYQAGLNETSSDRLYIDNTSTATPLIWGNFSTNQVMINGTLAKTAGTFLIDHPQDPANKVLRHSFVESPEMLNVYKGRAKLVDGQATVVLPGYFDALNGKEGREVFLTCVGGYSQLYVASVEADRFVVRSAGGDPGQAFSWMVTAVRDDPYARQNPIVVEERKGEGNRFVPGEYLNPDVYGVTPAR